jgi:hypothetical protein
MLTAHKGERVRELIEERGCKLLYYLPPYSPETSTQLRRLSRRSNASYGRLKIPNAGGFVVEAIGAAISAVTAKDACGFFEHCGYGMVVQSL